MKDLSETHPSLKGLSRIWEEMCTEVVSTKNVQKHTIDKAVLREIWERNAEKYLPDDPYTGEAAFITQVEKELGLEKEE